MKAKKVNFRQPVTLAGGGELSRSALKQAIDSAPAIVAADGAADTLAALQIVPDAIVGDMDSIGNRARWRHGPTQIVEISEQDSTDFEKCLYATTAPYYIGVGFTGKRMDHSLAVLHTMLAYSDKRVVLLSDHDAIVAMPAGQVIALDLPGEAIVSLFPFAEATGIRSHGLRWSIEGLRLSPGSQIGTSNRATGGEVQIAFDRGGVFLMLEPAHLDGLLGALGWKSSAV